MRPAPTDVSAAVSAPRSEQTRPFSAAEALAAAQDCAAWAVIRVKDSSDVVVLGGTPNEVESLLDIELETEPPATGPIFDRLVAVPFRQVRERGFEAHDDGTPLTVVAIEFQARVPLTDLIEALPDVEVTFSDRGGFETSDEAYAEVVRTIIDNEIGNGEGANLVIGRHYRAQLDGWGPPQALTVLRRLLTRERGAYWTYCFFTGDRFLVGASPERHVSVHAGEVRMNPISGTFRLRGLTEAERKPKLLDFLADEKEIYELFMVVDEELKMMCDLCHEGGQVLGPFLKPMSHLVHTEYLLAGRTDRDVREVLRDTMYAATVTGAPVENACRLIKAYEAEGRGYYAAALALIGRDAEGKAFADSPIVIRTADVDLQGRLQVTAGATLVRDSDPLSEVAETHAKAGGILTAFGLAEAPSAPAEGLVDLARDEDVLVALGRRNQRLSTFWLTDQGGAPPEPSLKGRTAVIVEGEDDFVNMLRHVLTVLGMSATIVNWQDVQLSDLDGHDLVIVGPGPGDPRAVHHPKIEALRGVVDYLLHTEQRFLSVCLGHQVLCARLGIDLAYKDIVFQGTQSLVDLGAGLGQQAVGFYNTFVARPGGPLPRGVTSCADPLTGDLHLIRGPHYAGVQFHAESILTQNGFSLLRQIILELVADTPKDPGAAHR